MTRAPHRILFFKRFQQPIAPPRNAARSLSFRPGFREAAGETNPMRSILLWAVGVPIPIILLVAFCTHHF
jgi:hypothetical protein